MCFKQAPAGDSFDRLVAWNKTRIAESREIVARLVLNERAHFCMSQFKITRREWPNYVRPPVPGFKLPLGDDFIYFITIKPNLDNGSTHLGGI